MRITSKNLNKTWKEIHKELLTRIIANRYIPQTHKKVLTNQAIFLTYESEELLYGGQAGGGKSDALLMSALEYVNEPDYHALLLRRTYKDLALPNAIMNRCANWLNPYVVSGEVKWDGNTKTYTFPKGATLTFGYLAHDNDLDQYQGSELQFVGFDELTQFTEKQYTYLHSRLRKLENSVVPIRMRAGTNPGGRGHEWVKKRFITGDLPFIPSSYLDNIYLDRKSYGEQLDKLDALTRQQLKFGDWDAVISQGLLMNREQFNQSLISYEEFKDWTPSYCTIGIDPASTGTDKFCMSCLVYFTNGKIVLVDLYSTPSSRPEEELRNFIIRNHHWKPAVVNFEKEAGSSPHYALNYWENILNDLMVKYGFYLLDTQASTTGSKYSRAMPHANLSRQGVLLFNKDIADLWLDGERYSPLQSLCNQYIYVHPDKSVMNDYPSPDELDSVSYAFAELQKVIIGLPLG